MLTEQDGDGLAFRGKIVLTENLVSEFGRRDDVHGLQTLHGITAAFVTWHHDFRFLGKSLEERNQFCGIHAFSLPGSRPGEGALHAAAP